MSVLPLLLLAVSYLLGSVPASYLAGRWARGIDLRQQGSGNLGATNTYRVLGAKIALPVLVFDLLKGLLPTLLFPRWDGRADWRWALAYGAAAILGHVFSLYLGFRGGKGVATGAGVFLALAPAAVAAAFVVWAGVLAGTRMVSLASILAAAALVPALALTGRADEVFLLGSGIALFVIASHRANLGRIIHGEEPRLGRPRTAAAAVADDEVSA